MPTASSDTATKGNSTGCRSGIAPPHSVAAEKESRSRGIDADLLCGNGVDQRELSRNLFTISLACPARRRGLNAELAWGTGLLVPAVGSCNRCYVPGNDDHEVKQHIGLTHRDGREAAARRWGIVEAAPQVGRPPAEGSYDMSETTTTKLLATIGFGALIASALVVCVTSEPGQAVAGSGNAAVNTFVQPTQGAMSFGATATAALPATTLATSLASPTLKATPLASECNTTGQCP